MAATVAAARGYREPQWMNVVRPSAEYLEEPGEDEWGWEGGHIIDPRDPAFRLPTGSGVAGLAVHGTQSTHAVPAACGVAGMWGENGDGRTRGMGKHHPAIPQDTVQRAGGWVHARLERQTSPQQHAHTGHTRSTHADSEGNVPQRSCSSDGGDTVPSGGVGSFIAQALVRAAVSDPPTVDTLLQYRSLDVQKSNRGLSRSGDMPDGHACVANEQAMYEVCGTQELEQVGGHRSPAVSRDAARWVAQPAELRGGAGVVGLPRGIRTPVRLAADAAATSVDDSQVSQGVSLSIDVCRCQLPFSRHACTQVVLPRQRFFAACFSFASA